MRPSNAKKGTKMQTEVVEHEVAGPRGISSQVQKEQERIWVCKEISGSTARKSYVVVNSQ
jgi:hypothetical protein